MVTVGIARPVMLTVAVNGSGLSSGRRRYLFRTFDNLVQLASIEPDASALRTVVDFDALALGHYESHVFT
ncbi:MAG: hypothetical protein JWO70_4156 [Betaproteobacteria bacterium]|nr:hypothetical protein [Betaproteobacteria bacterium]